jgi:hypothetical protein
MVREETKGPMKLRDWVTIMATRGNTSRRTVLSHLARVSGVSLMTLGNVDRNARLGNYRTAKAVSEATGGEVSVEDLCDD